MQDSLEYFFEPFIKEPEKMLPANMPEDVFDIVYVQSLDLLHAMSDTQQAQALNVDIITNIVADILRLHDIYDLYKDNLTGLVVIYASWVVLESLRREGVIDLKSVGFEDLSDNEILKDKLIQYSEAFQKKLSTEKIKQKK